MLNLDLTIIIPYMGSNGTIFINLIIAFKIYNCIIFGTSYTSHSCHLMLDRNMFVLLTHSIDDLMLLTLSIADLNAFNPFNS